MQQVSAHGAEHAGKSARLHEEPFAGNHVAAGVRQGEGSAGAEPAEPADYGTRPSTWGLKLLSEVIRLRRMHEAALVGPGVVANYELPVADEVVDLRADSGGVGVAIVVRRVLRVVWMTASAPVVVVPAVRATDTVGEVVILYPDKRRHEPDGFDEVLFIVVVVPIRIAPLDFRQF